MLRSLFRRRSRDARRLEADAQNAEKLAELARSYGDHEQAARLDRYAETSRKLAELA